MMTILSIRAAILNAIGKACGKYYVAINSRQHISRT